MCAVGVIVSALIPAHLMAAPNDPLPTYRFLGKERTDLGLDGGRVAVRFRTELVAAEAVSAAIESARNLWGLTSGTSSALKRLCSTRRAPICT